MTRHSPTVFDFTPAEVLTYYAVRLPKLKKTSAIEGRGPCPVHDGKDDNFSVNLQTGQWYCHSACDQGGGIIALEMALTGTDVKSATTEVFRLVGRIVPNGHAAGSYANVPEHAWRFLNDKIQAYENDRGVRCTHRFFYAHADGRLCYVKIRYELPNGTKTFQKYALTPRGGWTTPKRQGAGPLLYNLPLLADAKEIHICNGEKAADFARQRFGIVTTCTPDGEGRWDPSFTALLEGKRVYAYLDNDQKGQKNGSVISQNLLGHAAQLKLVQLPGLPPKGDLYDWIEAGGTPEDLSQIIEATPLVRALGKRQAEPISEKPATSEAGVTAFRLADDGVLFLDSDPDKEPLRICGRLEVAAFTRDTKSEGWGRLLRWRDCEDRAHQWAMPMSLLAGDGSEYRARLLDGGLFIAPGRKARDLLTVYLQTARPEDRVLCVGRVGWQGESFVLPSETIGPEGAGTVIFQTAQESEHLLNTAGTLSDWRENVGRLCSGNSRLILAVSCAFAGPLLSLVGAESGGIHIHGVTSTGKSTALWVGGSVLGGGGRNGFVQPWRSTETAIEIIAELHNDLCLYLDELAQIDARDAANTVYLLGNASGKGRGNRQLGARRRLNWSLLFVSAGEVTLSDHTQTAGKRTRGGAEVRLLNVDADAGAGMGLFEDLHGAVSAEAFSLQLKDATRRFYGTPLRAYLDRIVKSRADIQRAVKSYQEQFLKEHVPKGASGEVSRAAQRFGLIAAGGELATDAGITGWQQGEAMDAAARCLESWIATRGTIGAGDKESAISQVRRFIEANGPSRFQTLGPNDNQIVVNRAGFRRRTKEGETEYWVLPETFKSEVCAGFDYRMVVHALAERGFLELQPPDLTKNVRIPGNRSTVRVFCIKGSILED